MAGVLLFRGKPFGCGVGRVLPTIIGVTVGLSLGLAQVSAQTSSLPGKPGVGSSGAATYSVPISVPPGTAGMIPSLSLDYNSQSGALSGWLGAGLVGVGWSLSGLPAIGRCPRTVAQDGVAGAVNYDANDRFCLDGQRLVAVTGAYGADGTEYRTEIESFSKIVSHGTAGTGPAWFELRSKSGQILQFGNTTDSRILAQGKTTARSWGVNKVSDTKGNYFTVTYVNDAANGQAYPSRIDYTANDAVSLASYNSVRFVYGTNRSDITPIYHAGSLIKTTVRLANVQTYSGSALVADYRLAYQQGSASGRSQLASITLCDGSNNCLPTTSFTWQNGTTTPTVISNVAGQNGSYGDMRPYIGDFNGDGLSDVMWDDEPSDQIGTRGTRVLWTSTGTGGFNVDTNFAGQNGVLTPGQLLGGTVYFSPLIGDFNRDGRSDVWWYRSLTLPGVTWLSTPGAGVAIGTTPIPPSPTPIAAFDVNADGRTDLLWRNSSVLTVWRVNSDGTVAANNIDLSTYFPGTLNGIPISSIISAVSAFRPVDFNGDGVADILWSSTNGGKFGLWLGVGDGTFAQVSGVDASVNLYRPLAVDVNGDGKTDILWSQVTEIGGITTGQRVLWISRGDGTFEIIANPGGQNGTLVGYVPNAGDFNGDGIADVLWISVNENGISTGSSVAWLGRSDGTFTVMQNYGGGAPVGYVPILAEFNGDGKTDVLWDSRSGTDTRSRGTRLLWLSDGLPPDIIKTVTNGVGATVTLTYKSLTDVTVYTKDNTATDPIVDVQMPLQAVSRIDVSNGIGGTLATAYAYVGAKSDLNGRGFLGFRQVKTTDLQTNIVQTTTYRQDYPFLFSVANESQSLANATLGATANTYGSTSLGGTRYQVFLIQSQISKNDLDGTAVPSTTTSYQYDAFNNATQVAVATSDGYSKTTNNTYANDTANWLLGRLTASMVTAQAPQQLGQYCTLPWGGTVSNGQSVTAYSSATGPVGQSCSTIAQTRTCTRGSLSGSYAQQSCAALCALPWGGTINQGQSVTAYSTASMPSGQFCTSAAQTRTCGADGVLSGSYTSNSCTQNVTISSSSNNFNLWNHLVANGYATSGVAGTWAVTISSGVTIGSTSTASVSFDTGTFPAGSTLQLINNGTIVGRGGAGGVGASVPTGGTCTVPTVGGEAGGPALQMRLAATVTNNGGIWGGGGGGGGGGSSSFMILSSRWGLAGGGGGSGAGIIANAGGAGGSATSPGSQGGSGTLTSGGAGGVGGLLSGTPIGGMGGTGGGPGSAGAAGAAVTGSNGCAGAAGGAAGSAVLGNSFITWSSAGDRRGPLN